MNIVYFDPSELKPYPRNSKEHTTEQIKRIAASIEEFGLNSPVIVDEDNVILVGHGRVEAAIKLGLPTIPVYKKTGLTEAQKRAYRIIDNKCSSDTGYNYSNLGVELAALVDMGFDGQEFCFDEFDFKSLDLTPPPPEDDDEDDAQDDPAEWLGQITLQVPTDVMEAFEADIDAVVRKYDGVTKKVKKAK